MKIGDVIINPFVREDFEGKPNPIYKSMVISIGSKYTTVLRIDGETSQYYTKDCKDWKISHHVDLGALINPHNIKIKEALEKQIPVDTLELTNAEYDK